MNILPKKRWHVRTKDNIARVRRDEAEAAEQERKRQEKLDLAESEARINFLRKKSDQKEVQISQSTDVTSNTSNSTSEHIDLFADYKSHTKTTNKDLEKEKKDEKEKYEKQIGYLTYLGQDTNEALKLRSWYEVAPKRADIGDRTIEEKDLKNKFSHDPLTLINALLPRDKKTEFLQQKPNLKRPIQPVEEPQKSVEPKRLKVTKTSHKTKKHKKEKKHKRDKHKDSTAKHSKSKKKKETDKIMFSKAEQQRKKEKLEQLRKERLKREATERERQEALLAPKVEEKPKEPEVAVRRIVQKYNSQFNPYLAKQNII